MPGVSPNGRKADNVKQSVRPANAKSTGMFKIQTANEWIEEGKAREIPKMLADQLWRESELCILFAPTGVGKSIYGVQIADAISRGADVMVSEDRPVLLCQAKAQKVLVLDCELKVKQFENRYSNNYSDHYRFSDNFQRAEMDPDALALNDAQMVSEGFIKESLEMAVVSSGAKVLVIDNITFLKNETEKAKDALPLMKHLKALGLKYHLSILAIAHTPKRDNTRPLTMNDLQGSSMLSNFCDSMFAIGQSSKDNNLRYIKQLKARDCEKVYTDDNVIVCRIGKPRNFVRFDFEEYGKESDHLKTYDANDKQQLINRCHELSAQNKSQREIADEMSLSLGTVNAYLKKPAVHSQNS